MRIIAGKRRGLKLAGLGTGDAAAHLRPTPDRVRESLFNLLTGGRFGNPVESARVLDLCAGTGALGLEAWSRGAVHVSFVDDGAASRALIAANVAKADAASDCTHLRRDATRLGTNPATPYNLVFLDPPYGKALGGRALAAAQAGGWLAPDALIVWEDSAAQAPPPGFGMIETRRYGDTHLTLLRAPVTPPGEDASSAHAPR